ncbi:hypothetical protein BJ138DRAFT_62911 [Hygrophoropsis aurantiaca]|uniref:Uncharacterized protein n=1 Tax=Hygrophoropsis aurantiaca TaxID=72124 RepID=A0ACB8AC22_9AGAM|nr:hypothetical protein BJ138DRAFT_62911 [Hygrophoropsis aurantiaca]
MGNETREQDSQASTRTIIKVIEEELLVLEKEKSQLLARLRCLEESINHKHVLAGTLKNSLAPVYRLPSEILLACFAQAVQDWVSENEEADEKEMMGKYIEADDEEEEQRDLKWSCTPVFAISHVSHHWRQLAIHMPALWTNLVVTPEFEYHLDVFRDSIHRANGMAIAVKFQSFGSENKLSSSEAALIEAIMPLIHTQQINALSLVNAVPAYSFLLSWLEKNIGPPNPVPSAAFSNLTGLSILFTSGDFLEFRFTSLQRLLLVTPQLKSLEVQHRGLVYFDEQVDKAVINLPNLKRLTTIDCNSFTSKLLDSLFAPNVHQLNLLQWSTQNRIDLDYLFIDFDLKVPRFPNVQNLTISSSWPDDDLDVDLISAFPRVTHFKMCNPGRFLQDPPSLALPMFQQLQHFTLDFSYADSHPDPRGYFYWLPGPKDQANHPLLISVFNPVNPAFPKPIDDADKLLFRYYKELQQYGSLDVKSSRLEEFRRWQADGEPELGS